MKRWAKRLALVLVGTLVGLLVAEGVVRVLGLGGTSLTRGRLHAYDPEAGWRCSPDLDACYSQPGSFDVRVACNSRGLREAEKDFPKPPGTRRIVVLGDSFMWGCGVENEEMFSSILENEIPDTETINLGVNGYSTVQELVRLENEGLRYDPDWVVLAFCWNDLEDNFDDKRGGRPVAVVDENKVLSIGNRPVRKPWKSPTQQWLRHYPRLFTFCEYYSELLRRRLKQIRRARDVADDRPAEETSVATEHDNLSMEFSISEVYRSPRPALDRAYLAFELLLARVRELVEKSGGRLLVTYAIPKEVAETEFFREFMQKADGRDFTKNYDWDRPARRVGEICAALEIPYVDPSAAFRGSADSLSLFLKDNHHWAAGGHRLAAEEVARRIREIDGLSRPRSRRYGAVTSGQ